VPQNPCVSKAAWHPRVDFRIPVDAKAKRRMDRFPDFNWPELAREAIRRRLDLEERPRTPVERPTALAAARRMDEFRERIGPSSLDSTRAIRSARDGRSPS